MLFVGNAFLKVFSVCKTLSRMCFSAANATLRIRCLLIMGCQNVLSVTNALFLVSFYIFRSPYMDISTRQYLTTWTEIISLRITKQIVQNLIQTHKKTSWVGILSNQFTDLLVQMYI